MEGNLIDTPLSSVLELIHLTKQSGRVQVSADVPLSLYVAQGEIISGHILDWHGLEAVQSFLLHFSQGQFRFYPNSTNDAVDASVFKVPFSSFLTDWARLNDEWSRILPIIGSPSRALEPTQAKTSVPHPFQGGKSIRSLAKSLGISNFEVAQNAIKWVQNGDLRLTDRFAWHGLRIQTGQKILELPFSRTIEDIPAFLDGSRNIGEVIELGFNAHVVRDYLVQNLQTGEIQVPGSGWLLRDLTWELEHAQST